MRLYLAFSHPTQEEQEVTTEAQDVLVESSVLVHYVSHDACWRKAREISLVPPMVERPGRQNLATPPPIRTRSMRRGPAGWQIGESRQQPVGARLV